MFQEEPSTYPSPEDVKIGIVLPAAGHGERLQSSGIPKQFLMINGSPILAQTINAFFFISPSIRAIVIPVSHPHETAVRKILKHHVIDTLKSKLFLVDGCSSRHRSIMMGLNKISSFGVDLTIVHDAVRPIVDAQLVQKLIENALRYGAAGAICKLSATVLRTGHDSFLEESLDRSIHVESHTPQVFKSSLLLEAYNNATEDDLQHGTECLALVQRQLARSDKSYRVKLVEGDPNKLWKVTHRKDLLYALHSDTLIDSTLPCGDHGYSFKVRTIGPQKLPRDLHFILEDLQNLLKSLAATNFLPSESNGHEINDCTNSVGTREQNTLSSSSQRKCSMFLQYFTRHGDLSAYVLNVPSIDSRGIFFFILTYPTCRSFVFETLSKLSHAGARCIVCASYAEGVKSLLMDQSKHLHQMITSCLLHPSTFSGQVLFLGPVL